jgi:hypothetical protein
MSTGSQRLSALYCSGISGGTEDVGRLEFNPKERGGRDLPPKVVQTLLGHSSIVMTLDVYGHLFRDGGDRTELAEASRLLLA